MRTKLFVALLLMAISVFALTSHLLAQSPEDGQAHPTVVETVLPDAFTTDEDESTSPEEILTPFPTPTLIPPMPTPEPPIDI